MKHWFVDEWKIDNRVGYIECDKTLFNYVKVYKLSPQLVDFCYISYKKVQDFDRGLPRYTLANVNYPMIISELANPDNLPYRLIDGSHRIDKLIRKGSQNAFFYIIPGEIVLNFAVWVNP